MRHEVHKIVDAYRKQQVVREQCFGNYVNCQRFWFADQRYQPGKYTNDQEAHEVVGDKEN